MRDLLMLILLNPKVGNVFWGSLFCTRRHNGLEGYSIQVPIVFERNGVEGLDRCTGKQVEQISGYGWWSLPGSRHVHSHVYQRLHY